MTDVLCATSLHAARIGTLRDGNVATRQQSESTKQGHTPSDSDGVKNCRMALILSRPADLRRGWLIAPMSSMNTCPGRGV